MLVFEDIHWADSGTHDLLEALASRIRDVPLMLLALARPDLLLARPGWGGGLPAYTALPLETLGQRDANDLADRLLGGIHADVHRAIDTAEGNPLFIEELVASVLERRDLAGETLPTTIRELVSARLDALPASERTVLLDASVVGKVFWRGALEQLDGDAAGLSAVLDSLEARDLITFKHAVIRDVAYATLPRTRRKSLHAAVAAFLEDATASSAATATALAQHWREAGDVARARPYLLVAADQAFRGWAKDEAAVLYAQALELISATTEPKLRGEVARKRALAIASIIHIEDAQSLARRQEPESRPAAGSPPA